MRSPLPVRNGVNATRLRLPEDGPWDTALDYILDRFDHVNPDGIGERFDRGEVVALGGEVLTRDTPLGEHTFVWYYRELPVEERLPVELSILHQDERLLVVDKPHFLPTTPGGMYVAESALVRLRVDLDLPDLIPMHRLDRMTAGILMFAVDPGTRGAYQLLFENRRISKEYRAVAPVRPELGLDSAPMDVRSRIVKSRTYLLAQEVEGPDNTHTTVSLLDQRDDRGLYRLQPHTGKTHQLRLHMASLGLGILNDPFYPVLHPQAPDDYTRPLQLLAHSIGFTDPVDGTERRYESALTLAAFA
ncbi:pseudouridine synthase [Arthrobacter agilis]|uniref:RluA family pseudouridine synthase n=1 Tax=Arthrobacter agilis TaxID=37921 RepID=UPI000B358DAF|nr:RluA family pseudouridine synthase [Arthrobacter agilis]OUM43799.1 pseudouridine synthase [Arthrobacter agilis]PPB46840.1 pseudouridine synthase [Arthrobacter agilis]TPV24939.1 pseudouridine synthase [Arthrobacter agilis]